jgi:hypothetical protein
MLPAHEEILSIQLVTNNKYARQVRSCAAGFMTLSDYWAPGPPSPGFDIMSVFLYRVSCTRVSLGMGSALRYTGTCYC